MTVTLFVTLLKIWRCGISALNVLVYFCFIFLAISDDKPQLNKQNDLVNLYVYTIMNYYQFQPDGTLHVILKERLKLVSCGESCILIRFRWCQLQL